jgi:hypothetical protein
MDGSPEFQILEETTEAVCQIIFLDFKIFFFFDFTIKIINF